MKDIIYEYKEPQSQEISEVPDQQILSNEQDANDAVEDRQTDSNNDAVTTLENDKNSSQDQDNPGMKKGFGLELPLATELHCSSVV